MFGYKFFGFLGCCAFSARKFEFVWNFVNVRIHASEHNGCGFLRQVLVNAGGGGFRFLVW